MRWIVAAFAAFFYVLPIGPASEAADQTYTLQVSSSPARLNPSSLQGTVSGLIYVFVDPSSGVRRVRFFLDDPLMTRSPRQTDNKEPYDFAGSTGSAANPFNTASVSNGSHTITAAIELSGGSTQVVKTVNATFTVSNPKTLTVTNAGTGTGTVTSSPAGVNCGPTV